MTKLLVTVFLGWLGIHKFMERKNGLGIIYLLTGGLFGIGWLIDIIIALIDFKKPYKNNSTIRIDVVGEAYKRDNIKSILSMNKMYFLKNNAFIEQFPPEKKIYKYEYLKTNALLVPEPNNSYDKNAIKVMIDNTHVGYIPAEKCLEIKKILHKIKSVRAELHGGEYKFHLDNEIYTSEYEFSIELYITI